MRLAKLYLKAFGPYTERVIELDASGASLHLVYGPNEAGKSSLLRAIRALFFGIPERTLDNFLHENTALRVGGVITGSDGQPFPLIRRKARKQPLREWNAEVGNGADCEGRNLPDDAISTCFDGIGEAQFSRLFGVDRNELIAGGQAILEGRGDVGESLFEAGAGLVGLRRLRAALETEAGELFAPRASKPLINATLGAYESRAYAFGIDPAEGYGSARRNRPNRFRAWARPRDGSLSWRVSSSGAFRISSARRAVLASGQRPNCAISGYRP